MRRNPYLGFLMIVWATGLAGSAVEGGGGGGETVNSRLGLPAGGKFAVVWADHRVSGPPDTKAPFLFVPQYDPTKPYVPSDPASSPLFPPPKKGARPYLGDRPYKDTDGDDILAELGPDPESTNPADTEGYGRAYNLPTQLPPTAGNAPAVLMNSATEARPPDLAAIAAAKAAPQAQSAEQPGTSAGLASVMLVPAAHAPTTAPGSASPTAGNAVHAIPQTQPVSMPKTAPRSPLSAAFNAEDERHARANLPEPVPPK